MISPDTAMLNAEDIHSLAREALAPMLATIDPFLASSANDRHPRDVIGNPKILIVDDEPINIKVVRKYLSGEGYEQFVTTTEPRTVLELLHREEPDLVLMDVMMPEISGLELLAKIRALDELRLADVPVLILTAASDQETRFKALELGATDFLAKPLDLPELLTRVKNALVLRSHQDRLRGHARELEAEVRKRTAELISAQLDLIHCLAQAAEFRDNDTGRHVIRVGRYAGIIAQKMDLEPMVAEVIEQAAPLHDVGKIGIPDAILLKPDKLDPEEFQFMQHHCGFGKKIFEKLSDQEAAILRSHPDTGAKIMNLRGSPLLRVAARIALTHHEKWDGNGYPLGLAGEDIPIEGRVTAVADVFDALSSQRPYKPPFPLEKCFDILDEGRGTHFDPTVLGAFFAARREIVQVQIQYADIG